MLFAMRASHACPKGCWHVSWVMVSPTSLLSGVWPSMMLELSKCIGRKETHHTRKKPLS